MILSHDDIEKILSVSDSDVRRRKLRDAAAELGVLEDLIKRTAGQYDEQQLVVAVFDGMIARQRDKVKNRRFIIFTSVGFAAAIFFVVFLPRAAVRYIRFIKAKSENRSKAYKGFDEKGKLVEDEKGQPVLFHDMEGYYDEYYDDGTLRFEYLYSGGKIVEQKEYDRRGQLITHFVYDAEGKPFLVDRK